jgi:hypothetical protein
MDLFVYRIRIATLGLLKFDKFPGIPLEGALGEALKSLSCSCPGKDAEARCTLRRRCIYNLLMRPRAQMFEGIPLRYATPTPPLVLRPRFSLGSYARGTELELQLVLVGHARMHFRWVLAALGRMGLRGVGPARASGRFGGCFEIRGVDAIGPRGEVRLRDYMDDSETGSQPWRFPEDFATPDPNSRSRESFTVELRSPTLVATKSAPGGSLEFNHLVAALARRVSVLSLTFGEEHLIDREEHYSLQAHAAGVRLAGQACRWENWPRYSRLQQREMRVKGWTGWARYEGDVTPFLPLLRLGALLHVGEDTIRGCGEIVLRDGV